MIKINDKSMTNHRYDYMYICSMKKIVVCGSRSFCDMDKVRKVMPFFLSRLGDVVIVSGAARGADALGELWAAEMGMDVMRFPADWGRFGRSAGMIRNADMCAVADGCVAFWDGVSRGTKGMIDLCRRRGVPVRVVMI